MGKAWPALDIKLPASSSQLPELTAAGSWRLVAGSLIQELVLAELDGFEPSAIQESDDSSRLRAFFGSVESRDAAARALASAFGSHLFVEALDVEDEDWAARSQAELRAVAVGRLVIAPPWDVRVGASPLLTIVIQPSMGFGTGHHATTRLMLNALQSIPVQGRTVLDVGCGSGVLAIATARLDARSALGIDIDVDALANAAENLELNAVSDRVRFEAKDFRDMSSAFGVVMANLTSGLLESSASKLAALVEVGGYLIVSGFLESDRRVVPAFEEWLLLQNVEQDDGWMCAVLLKSALQIGGLEIGGSFNLQSTNLQFC